MHCAIQRQLNGDSSGDDDDDASETKTVQISPVERRPIAINFTIKGAPVTQDQVKCSREQPSVKTADDPLVLPKLEPEERHNLRL
jgi:hypothetical protein